MRHDDERVADILDAARAVHARLSDHSLETLRAARDAIKATFFDVIVIGEAVRDLVAKRDAAGKVSGDDSPFVQAYPQIPWLAWVGMRDMVTHQYFRAAPDLVWRDYQAGEFSRLVECCANWLERSQ